MLASGEDVSNSRDGGNGRSTTCWRDRATPVKCKSHEILVLYSPRGLIQFLTAEAESGKTGVVFDMPEDDSPPKHRYSIEEVLSWLEKMPDE